MAHTEGLALKGVGEKSSIFRVIGDYVQLTKPRIVLLFGLTGLASMILEGSLLDKPVHLWAVFFGIVFTAGSANALNQYWDRDIDSVMERTRKKRPLPQGKMSPASALGFSIVLGVLATWLLLQFANWLTAALGLGTIAFYIGIYTMWLKRRTPYNIVIGGAAGATAPLMGWAAATGTISFEAWILFAIVFFWTPPHFWALSLCVQDEYAKAEVPMLPVVAGEKRTRNEIFVYTLLVVPLALTLLFSPSVSWLYGLAAFLLGAEFLRRAFSVWRVKQPGKDYRQEWRLFGFSIFYLLALFSFLMLDSLFLRQAHAAEKVPQELENVGFEEHFGAQVDLNSEFLNEKGEKVVLRSVINGRTPTFLFLVYYGCPNLCNFFLNGALESLKKFSSGPGSKDWVPGKQFNILTISIDPRETPELAMKKKENYVRELGIPGAEKGWNFWVVKPKADGSLWKATDETEVKALANTVGFRYRYDKDQNQFAHSAGIVVLTAEGKVSRYLYGIDFQPKDLRLALVEAGGKKIGSFVDRLLLFCYNYDPKTRKYAFYAMNVMRLGGGLTVALLGSMFFRAWRRNRMTGLPA